MPVILVTDILVWLLVAVATGYAFYCARHPHLAIPWARVFRSSAAMASVVLLSAYISLGLLDSLHFRPALEQKGGEQKAYSSDVLSVLDLALARLRGRGEKTYSAPLATRSYAKEQVELPDGRQMRDFPRLRFGGAHLKDESAWAEDVTKRALAVVGVALVLLVLAFLALGPIKRRRPEIPWHAAFGAFAVLLLLAGPATALSTGYHVLGTDKVGQDVFYLALKSIRTSLAIGTLTTLVLLPVGIALGTMAGYFRGCALAAPT